jgi:hypothetical protein
MLFQITSLGAATTSEKRHIANDKLRFLNSLYLGYSKETHHSNTTPPIQLNPFANMTHILTPIRLPNTPHLKHTHTPILHTIFEQQQPFLINQQLSTLLKKIIKLSNPPNPQPSNLPMRQTLSHFTQYIFQTYTQPIERIILVGALKKEMM